MYCAPCSQVRETLQAEYNSRCSKFESGEDLSPVSDCPEVPEGVSEKTY